MALGTRTFRIFVSSTFTDLVEERNRLRERVFPALKRLCAEEGTRFQDIDLRWGVSEEAALDQQTMNICLGEVDRCRSISPRPNFIVLLGDRYGWRPVPPQIPADEFEEICRQLPPDKRTRVESWYQRDENAEPAVYDLKPRSDEFEDYETWEAEENLLRSILLEGFEGTSLTPAQRLKFEASATEQEIQRGALGSADAHEHVFCFFRTITDLPTDERAKGYIDFDPVADQPDMDASHQQSALKKKLEDHLPGHIKTYEARWTDGGPTTDHLEQLCDDVIEALSGVIRQQVDELEDDKLKKEIEAHELFRQDRARNFVGRVEILRRISDYADAPNGRPLAVVGRSGSGKSALMAFAADEARKRYPSAEVVVRFIGATPASSDGRQLLIDLCGELSRVFEPAETPVPTEWKELVEELPKRLALATQDRPLIVFLDALDQLSDAESARNLTWLPTELPDNVRLIVSTMRTDRPADKGVGEPLRALEVRLPESNLLEVGPMPAGEGEQMLDAWLDDPEVQRRLQPHQRAEVLGKFAANGLPLYLRLAFEEARRWKSYTPPEETVLASDIPGIIRDNLLERLSDEENHGELVVSRSLGYLGAARHGLSEDELLDVLSADQEVFEEFMKRAHHEPPEQRLPVVVWSRLFSELEPYLAERESEGGRLLAFYHRQLSEVVAEDFLAGENGRARHQHLATYFNKQPHTSLRKLAELPYQQTMGELWDELFETLTNFEFLERKAADLGVVKATDPDGNEVTTYTGIYLLREDFERALQMMPGDGSARAAGDARRIIVTGVDLGKGMEIRCPHCNTSSPFRDEWKGQEIECPNEECKGSLRVNAFVVERRP